MQVKPTVKTHVTSVYLKKTGDQIIHPFFCQDCRNLVMRYKGEVISVSPYFDTVETLPIEIQCSNEHCRKKYAFMYFVEELE